MISLPNNTITLAQFLIILHCVVIGVYTPSAIARKAGCSQRTAKKYIILIKKEL